MSDGDGEGIGFSGESKRRETGEVAVEIREWKCEKEIGGKY